MMTGQRAQTVELRVLETSDLHTHALGYDYYQDKPTGEFGLEYTASLIGAARAEKKNVLLFDNGDLIQGNPLGDYVARVQPLKAGEVHPMLRAMQGLKYDAWTLGNHEFNYGLDYLDRVLKASPFPVVNANVLNMDGSNRFTPYLIQRRVMTDSEGRPAVVNVGIIGFTPPQILQWDKASLEGKVKVMDVLEAANRFVPQMKAKGADVIVALNHAGIDRGEYMVGQEQTGASLTKVPGIDVVLTGHSHLEFPSATYKDVAGADIARGTINGKPVAMPGFWGNNLGVLDLKLSYDPRSRKWSVTDSVSALRPIWDKANKKSLVQPDPTVAAAVKAQHEGTLTYVRGKVADLSAPINSYWALVQDDPSVQLVSNAQIAYVGNALKDTPYKDLPVLSAAAPFKAGGRSGASYYTDIPAGTLAIKNVADLYVYPNTVQAVLVNGAGVQEWLERSAGQFKQIDPAKTEPQALVDESFPTYNFDVLDGVTYEIDVTQPSRYGADGQLANPNARRIKNLQYQGKPIDPAGQFVIATNNYRASGGGKFPGLDGKNIILQAPDETRQALISYFQDQKTVNPSADNNWQLTPVPGATLLIVSSPNAQKYLPAGATLLKTRDDGFAEYTLKF
ncbi:2',3'-cyclic-nucleotide 2'-phosphodiesterase / 3'-nucleotidase [Deinococcus reticulitermitis]|uniref:2',3'-cyclic-nucleotide 2'-phosphodiesterase / 3'-nucleotidase n=1 Tax=Deinococcus reticulitermitis TaxID=856736 RepID=A0A1H6SIA8_9DEIO|nr:2',3'-cyclic-nucleotide 2'-phosphodiesterase [Deinococcus reticulitermitis]SEI64597.1 2',3'-cyclic-nucleotide 2'-phosphodiesterase / 3'-nucleotidase [Deinococcus reticulitermitis]